MLTAADSSPFFWSDVYSPAVNPLQSGPSIHLPSFVSLSSRAFIVDCHYQAKVVDKSEGYSGERALTLNHLKAPICGDKSSFPIGSLVSTCKSLLGSSHLLAAGNLEEFGSDKLSSEVAVAVRDHNMSTALSSNTISESRETSRYGQEGLWSVVIPTYNRLPILSKCLQALEEQIGYTLGGIESFEIVVVDDGSTDGTIEFLRHGKNNRLNLAKVEHTRITSEEPSVEDGRLDRQISESESKTAICCGESEYLRLGMGRQSNLEDNGVCWHCEAFPHVKLVRQKHGGAAKARNLGLKYARGAIIVFIDSDLVVTEDFLRAHGHALQEALLEDGDDRAFTYGRVINTSNFENPRSEKFKITDHSAAFFATGNVAISRRRLLGAGKLLGCNVDGPFDVEFSEYGWEDLELGVRLRQGGARIKHAPAAVGYHWHPAFSVEQLPRLIEQERQRGRNGVHFYHKHPTLSVQLMIQMTPFHELLWFLLTLGGLINERNLEPLLSSLVLAGRHRTAALLVSPVLNWHTVQAVKEESRKLM